jgi:hypothetical protein
VTFAEFRDRRKIFDIEGYTRQQFKAEVIPGLEPTQRFPSTRPPQGNFSDRGGREQPARDRGYAGASRSEGRGGFNDRQRVQGAPEGRSFAPRRDAEGFGRKPGFGDTGRGGFAGPREGAAPAVISRPASQRSPSPARRPANPLRRTMRASARRVRTLIQTVRVERADFERSGPLFYVWGGL